MNRIGLAFVMMLLSTQVWGLTAPVDGSQGPLITVSPSQPSDYGVSKQWIGNAPPPTTAIAEHAMAATIESNLISNLGFLTWASQLSNASASMTNLMVGASMTHPDVQVLSNSSGGGTLIPEAITGQQKGIALQDPTVQTLLAANNMMWEGVQGDLGQQQAVLDGRNLSALDYFSDAGELPSAAASLAQKITAASGIVTHQADTAIETNVNNPLGVVSGSALGFVEQQGNDAIATDGEFQQAERLSFAALQTRSPSIPATGNAALEQDVRKLLREWAAAFQGLDAQAVKKLQPSVDEWGLADAFTKMQSLDVKIDQVKILTVETETPPGPYMPGTVPPSVPTSMRVSCHVSQVMIVKDGTKKVADVIRVVRLKRNPAGNWIIDTFER